MKTLLLMRHAKSSWKKPNLRDHERPLSRRGKKDAPRMGRWLLDQDLAPEWVVSSSAKRARKTAKKVARECGWWGEIVLADELYPGDLDSYLHVLNQIDAASNVALVVGHNPILEEVVSALTGAAVLLPTGAIACVELPIANWTDLTSETTGHLRYVGRPREKGVRAISD